MSRSAIIHSLKVAGVKKLLYVIFTGGLQLQSTLTQFKNHKGWRSSVKIILLNQACEHRKLVFATEFFFIRIPSFFYAKQTHAPCHFCPWRGQNRQRMKFLGAALTKMDVVENDLPNIRTLPFHCEHASALMLAWTGVLLNTFPGIVVSKENLVFVGTCNRDNTQLRVSTLWNQ